jgi:peroxin-10
MILCHAVAPYCIDRLLDRLQQRLERPDVPAELSQFAAIIPAVRHAVTIIHRCHLATFYLQGVFYHVAKRLAGTRYVRVENLLL